MPKKLSQLSPAERKKKVSQLAKSPGTRYKIPDEYLPAEYRVARKYARAMATEVAPGLTEGDLRKQIDAQAGMKYGGAEQALAQSVQGVQAQQPVTADWFKQYQNAIAAASQQQVANQQQAAAAIQGLQQGVTNVGQQQWGTQQAGMAADAANRGATLDPALAAQSQNAAGVRSAMVGSFGANLLTQGLNTQNYLGDRGIVAGKQGLEAAAQDLARLYQLRQQGVELEREKGAYKVSARGELIGAAGDAALKGALTRSQIGQNAASIESTQATTAKTKAATAYLKKYGYEPGTAPSPTEQARLEYFSEKGYFPPTGPPRKDKGSKPASGPGSLPAGEEAKRWSRVRKYASLMQRGYQVLDSDGEPVKTIKGRDAVKQYLLSLGYDPLAIQVAESLARNKGKLGPNGVKAAHKYGLHVSGNAETVR